MDETGAYYTEWSKPESKTPVQYTNAYIGEDNGTPLQCSSLENSPLTLLVGMQTSTATMENSVEIP